MTPPAESRPFFDEATLKVASLQRPVVQANIQAGQPLLAKSNGVRYLKTPSLLRG